MSATEAAEQTAIRPFEVSFSDSDLAELRRRITATRWPECETVGDDSQGVPLETMQELAAYNCGTRDGIPDRHHAGSRPGS
jgi:Epoxide hydrolase N terminus